MSCPDGYTLYKDTVCVPENASPEERERLYNESKKISKKTKTGLIAITAVMAAVAIFGLVYQFIL